MGSKMISYISNSLLFALMASSLIPESEQQDMLKLSLYYETYCPDSINFVTKQLDPLMGAFSRYPDWLILDLIPYGFAKETSHFKFTCQHGTKECAGNKLNACAIDQLVTQQYHPLYMRLVNFIYCTMLAKDQMKASHKCADQTGVNYKQLMKCYNGAEANKLMEMYANRTASLQPPLSWVPTVVFNDKYNQTINTEAQTDLHAVVCSYMPNACIHSSLNLQL